MSYHVCHTCGGAGTVEEGQFTRPFCCSACGGSGRIFDEDAPVRSSGVDPCGDEADAGDLGEKDIDESYDW